MDMEAQFLTDIIDFLKQVKWLYDFPMTQIFTRNVFATMPEDWCVAFADINIDTLNKIPDCISIEKWPSSLKDFLGNCKELSLQQWMKNSPYDFTMEEELIRVPNELCKGMCVKKKHEVEAMVNSIKHMSKVTNCSRVLDIGSGMGYVDSALHHCLKLTVLGAESEDYRVKSAQSRQEGLEGPCKGIRYIKWALKDDPSTLDHAKEITHQLKSSDVTCTCIFKGLRSKRSSSIKPIPQSIRDCEDSNVEKSYNKPGTEKINSYQIAKSKSNQDDLAADVNDLEWRTESRRSKELPRLKKTKNSSKIVGNDGELGTRPNIYFEGNKRDNCLPTIDQFSSSHEERIEESWGQERAGGDRGMQTTHLSSSQGESHCEAETNPSIPLKRNKTDKHSPKPSLFCSRDETNSVMLIGLHSCADLSPIMIKMFQNCSDISSLFLFSCCYHKLKTFETVDVLQNNANSTVDCELGYLFPSSQTRVTQETNTDSVNISNSNSLIPNTEAIKGEVSTKSISSYHNFPMSQTLKQLMKKNDFDLSVFGLRLAAQESGVRWLHQSKEYHENHQKSVVYRALLESFCQTEGLSLRKRRRRCARKSRFSSFNEYIKTVIENYEFIPLVNSKENCHENMNLSSKSKFGDNAISTDKNQLSCEYTSDGLNKIYEEHGNTRSNQEDEISTDKYKLSSEYIGDSLKKIYKEYEKYFHLIEPLTGLQLALQPVLEAFVLMDRVTYLKEHHFEKVWLKSVFDVALSPRNVALIAVR